MVLKTMILPVWTPISGLLWWFFFNKNILEDTDGRSLLEIFRNPNAEHTHELFLPQERKRNPHSHVMSLESDPCANVDFSFFLVAGGIHVDVPYWYYGIFQRVIVHRHLQEYFYKNYTTKLSHLSASTLGVSLS